MKSFKITLVLALITSLSGLSQAFDDDDINNNEPQTPLRTPRRERDPDEPRSCKGPDKKKGRVALPRPFGGRFGPTEFMNGRVEEIAALPLLPGEHGTPEFDALHANDNEDEQHQPRDLGPAFNEPADLEAIRVRLVAELLENLARRLPTGCGCESGEMGHRYF